MQNQIDAQEAVNVILSANCNLPLAAERLRERARSTDSLINLKITEYDLLEIVANEPSLAKTLGLKLRTMALVNLYALMSDVQFKLASELDNLKASDVSRLYTSLQATLAVMTSPDTKQAFDFDAEIEKLVDEFGISAEEARKEIKHMTTKSGVR